MNLKPFLKSYEKLLVDNAPTILSAIAVIGTGATAYLAARGGVKAGEDLYIQNADNHMTTTDKVKLTWLEFVPAVGAAGLTIGCIVCANRISTKRVAAIAAAYSLSEGKLKEYKAKIEEKLGIEKAEDIEDEIVQDRINQTPVSQTIILGDGDQLCFDAYSGRYFRSTINDINKAANETNQLVIKENYQTLDDFWDLIGLEATAYASENGWNVDNLLEVDFGTMVSSDGKPCLVVKYDAIPIRGWNH